MKRTKQWVIEEAKRQQTQFGYRYGQAVYNVMNSISPSFVDSTLNTAIDPFYFDKRVEAFLRAAIKNGAING